MKTQSTRYKATGSVVSSNYSKRFKAAGLILSCCGICLLSLFWDEVVALMLSLMGFAISPETGTAILVIYIIVNFTIIVIFFKYFKGKWHDIKKSVKAAKREAARQR